MRFSSWSALLISVVILYCPALLISVITIWNFYLIGSADHCGFVMISSNSNRIARNIKRESKCSLDPLDNPLTYIDIQADACLRIRGLRYTMNSGDVYSLFLRHGLHPCIANTSEAVIMLKGTKLRSTGQAIIIMRSYKDACTVKSCWHMKYFKSLKRYLEVFTYVPHVVNTSRYNSDLPFDAMTSTSTSVGRYEFHNIAVGSEEVGWKNGIVRINGDETESPHTFHNDSMGGFVVHGWQPYVGATISVDQVPILTSIIPSGAYYIDSHSGSNNAQNTVINDASNSGIGNNQVLNLPLNGKDMLQCCLNPLQNPFTEACLQNMSAEACVRIRGLGFSSVTTDVYTLLDKYNLLQCLMVTEKPIVLLKDPKKRKRHSGQAIVQMRSYEDACTVQNGLHLKWIDTWNRYLEVFTYTPLSLACPTPDLLECLD